MTVGPLVTGIPALGPGARRVINWGQFAGLLHALDHRTVRVTASYTATRGDVVPIVTDSWVEAFS